MDRIDRPYHIVTAPVYLRPEPICSTLDDAMRLAGAYARAYGTTLNSVGVWLHRGDDWQQCACLVRDDYRWSWVR